LDDRVHSLRFSSGHVTGVPGDFCTS
jgi:hypothetical protein